MIIIEFYIAGMSQ